jgi:hypothetical protein
MKIRGALRFLGVYFAISFGLWLCISATYGASAGALGSPLYNTAAQEIRAVTVYIPALSAVLGLGATIVGWQKIKEILY